MGKIINKTNIPNKLIRKIINFIGLIEPTETIIKNPRTRLSSKKEDGLAGTNGKIIINPITETNFPILAKSPFFYKDKTVLLASSLEEYLVIIISHEIRHLWQYQNWSQSKLNSKKELEQDAVKFEIKTIKRWKKKYGLYSIIV